jgi:hypothetical protein
MTEMANLHNISMAGLQAAALAHAAPGHLLIKPGTDLQDFVVPETSPENLHLCRNQKFRSTRYESFSVLGLSLILSISFFIIVSSLYLPQLVGGWDSNRVWRKNWIEDDALHLQRKAFQGMGIQPWEGVTESVPLTKANFVFEGTLQTVRGRSGSWEVDRENMEEFELCESLEPLNRALGLPRGFPDEQ